MKLIELTTVDDLTIFVNPAHIIWADPSRSNTGRNCLDLYCTGGIVISVMENNSQINQRIALAQI